MWYELHFLFLGLFIRNKEELVITMFLYFLTFGLQGIAFQKKHHQLFSASHDKTIKVWNLDEMAYVETL